MEARHYLAHATNSTPKNMYILLIVYDYSFILKKKDLLNILVYFFIRDWCISEKNVVYKVVKFKVFEDARNKKNLYN